MTAHETELFAELKAAARRWKDARDRGDARSMDGNRRIMAERLADLVSRGYEETDVLGYCA